MTDDRPPPPPRRTLRHHLLALLVPPLAALTLLCGYVAHATAGQIAADRAAADATEATHAPAAVVRALQAERRATVAWLAPRPPAADALDSPGAAARAETARRAADATRDAEATLDPGSYPEAAERLAELAPLRTRAAEGRADWGLLYRAQTSAVSALLDTPGAEAGATVPPALDRAAELLARQDALLLAADADGALPAPVRDQFAEAAAGRTALEASLPAALTGPAREAFDTLGAGGAHRAAESAGERLAAPEQTVPAARELREEWSQAHRGLAEGYDRTRELARSTAASDAGAWPAGPALPLLAAALLAAALTLSLRAATRLRTELDAVREEALDVARRHLPSATRRAR
ncbi:nitrate- and nitrite sensing domain-containing protein, partial [Streptomyces lonarensis]